MLQAMRSSVGSWIAKIILGLLIVAFAVWGVNFNLSTENQALMEVGDQEVTPAEFQQVLYVESNRLRQRNLLDQVPQEIFVGYVRSKLVNTALYEEEAKSLGVTSTPEMVARDIRNDPAFQVGGNFSADRYGLEISNLGLSRSGYEFNRQRELLGLTLENAIDSSAAASKKLNEALFLYQNEKRDLSFIRIAIDENAEVGTPSDEDLQAFYDARKELFRAPEYRGVTYVEITPELLAKNITISEEELQNAYEERKDSFTRPESRQVKQMLLDDEETARKAHAALSEGQSFEAVAEEIATQTADDINLGRLTRRDVPDEALANAVFSLQDAGFSDPVEGLFGWFIVDVSDIQPESISSFEEVKDGLEAGLVRRRAEDEAIVTSRAFDDEIAAGSTLEEAAASMKLAAIKIEKLDSRGQDQNRKIIAGLPSTEVFRQFAFDTEQGLDSLMQDNGQGGYFILRVDTVDPTRIQDLDEVRDRAISRWQDDQRRNQAEETAKALTEKLNQGTLIGSAEILQDRTLETAIGLLRTGETENNKQLPHGLVEELFQMDELKAAYGRDATSYVVAVVDSINQPDLAAEQDSLDALMGNVTNSIRNDLLVQYNQALRTKHGVVENESRIQYLLSNMH